MGSKPDSGDLYAWGDLSGTMDVAAGIGGLLAWTDHRHASLLAHALYHTDGNGNILALVATNGVMLGRYHYALTNFFANRVGYVGDRVVTGVGLRSL